MLSKEEREAIRARCELSKSKGWQDDTYHVDGVIALLDALEEALIDKIVYDSTVKQIGQKILEVTRLTADRDKWKTRAQALERGD